MKMHALCHRQTAANCLMLFTILFVALLLTSSILRAQDYQVKNDRILAPEVTHFTRVAEPGVDAHGDLSLSIPLMTIAGRDGLDFPLVAQYRSGIQVKHSASWIGLGWELDLGSITRHPMGGLGNPNFVQADLAYAVIGDSVVIQSQPDVYSANMNGSSTLLLSLTKESPAGLPFDPAMSEGSGPCFGSQYSQFYFIPSPWKPWKFCYMTSTPVTVDGQRSSVEDFSRKDFAKLIITTENGTRYVFAQPTLSHAFFPPGSASTLHNYKFVSTWRLTAVLAPSYTGPDIPDSTSKGAWVKIVYKAWDRLTGSLEDVETVLDNSFLIPQIIAQITYPYYVETPTHFAFFKTSRRYDRDLGVLITGTMSNGDTTKYYSRKLDKITLYKKSTSIGVPMPESNPQSNGVTIMEVSFSYLKNGADSLITNTSSTLLDTMMSKLTLKKITMKGLQGMATQTLPQYKFSYYNDFNASWLKITDEADAIPSYYWYDDFGYPRIPLQYGGPLPKGWMWSLKEIVYPEGGSHFIKYANDSLSTLNFNYNKYVASGSSGTYSQIGDSFEWLGQGGPRVQFIARYNGYNASARDTVKFTYGPGHHSAISEVWFRKQPGLKDAPLLSTGERGQANVTYEWVQQKFADGSAIKTYYETNLTPEPQTLYLPGSAGVMTLLQGNTRWNWGEIQKIEYFDPNSVLVKRVTNIWTFRGHFGDTSPIKIATVAPRLPYGLGSDSTNAIYLNFTHKELELTLTNDFFASGVVSSSETYDYIDGTLLSKRTETSGDGKTRVTEHEFAFKKTGETYFDMMTKNMRSQIAQTSVKNNNPSNNGYTSTVTTWKDTSGKYLPHKEFHWRNSTTAAAIPSFNWATPSETNGWILTQTFDKYDLHGNLTSVKDANGVATSFFWDSTATLIDSIKTRPNSTLKPLTTKYTYDPNTFRLTAITDPNNQKTQYIYDPLQRLTEIINPDKRTVTNHIYYYSRDGNGGNFVNTDPNYVQTMTSTHAEHVRNHDFEVANSTIPTLPDFWYPTNSGSGSGTWDNTTAFSGAKSLKAYILSAGVGNRVVWKATFDEPVSAKKYYRMEVWIKKAAGTAGDSIAIELKFHNSAHTQTEVKKRTIALSSVTTGWLKFILEFTPLASTDHLYEASLDFRPNNAGTVWFDRFNFYELGVTRIHADGLGRDIQTRQRWGTGSIKTATVYDFASRVIKATKPYQSANLSFTLAAVDSANAWYSQTAGNHPAYQSGQSSSEKEYDTSPYAFSETEYYSDPLNRVRNQYFPGAAFSKNGPDKKYVKNFYTTNAAGELGFAANKVLETRIIDENLVQSEIFTDTFGNKVGVRVDSANATPADSTKLATLFQYDILSNLTKIVPPKAFQSNGNTPILTSPLCTNMTYNTLSQLTRRVTPDAGTDSSYYDKKGNLRFVKDAKAAAGNYFIYYKYDNLNRKIEEGTMPVGSPTKFKQSKADSAAFPIGGHTPKVKFQYDSTTYAANGVQRNLRGRLDAIEYVDDRFPQQKGYIFYSYDSNGNLEWINPYIPTGTSIHLATRTDYQYDALGKVTKTYFRRVFPPGALTDAFYVWYDYDALGRLERVFTNTADVKPLTPINAQYSYWPSGQVKRLALGSTVQGVDYLYNSRDWLTQINHHALLKGKDPGNDSTNSTGMQVDRFGEIIGYNKQKYIANDAQFSSGPSGYLPQYNGNISWITLNTLGNTNPVGFSTTGWIFRYDKANRLGKANWGHFNTTNNDWLASSRYDVTGPTAPDSLIRYDRNGNLLAMIRRDQNGGTSNGNFTYNYTANTNKLHKVAGLNGQDINNYVYDQNGNMIQDKVRLGPTNTITYDYRNLPTQVPISGNNIYFGYDGKGQRVSKNNLFYVPGADGKVLAVYDINGTHLYWNIWGLDLIGQRFWKQ